MDQKQVHKARGWEGWEARKERRAPESLQSLTEGPTAANARGERKTFRSPVMG